MPKLLKVKPLKEVLLRIKSSVSIMFKLSDEMVPPLVISSAEICHFNCHSSCINRCTCSIKKAISCCNIEVIRINSCRVLVDKISSCCNIKTICINRCTVPVGKISSCCNIEIIRSNPCSISV